MMEKYYPYRTRDGRRSILEAVGRQDAREWLRMYGKGVRFCEVKLEFSEFMDWRESDDRAEIVDYYLSQHRNFVT